MPEKSYFIMLADPPWAGPVVKVMTKPDVIVDSGVPLPEVREKYEVLLAVDDKAKKPLEFPPCDIHGPSRTLVFSKRFIDVLAEVGVDNIQYLDADVTYEPTGEKLSYKVANVLGIDRGLDMTRSSVTLSPHGNIVDIEAMCFDESKFGERKMFRLQEHVISWSFTEASRWPSKRLA